MENDMNNVLDKYTNEIFKVVAECYADGSNSQAKPNVKELLRIVWHKARSKACLEVETVLHNLAGSIAEDKKWSIN